MFLPTLIAQFGDGITSPSKAYTEGGTTRPGVLANFDLIISNLLGLFTIIGALIFVVYFLIAAIQWITAGGDAGKLTEAREKIIQGVLGLVILVAAYGILGLIGTLVGIDILNPVTQLEEIIPKIGPY
ncbi:MAG: hypothetical protein COZ34_03275 [Candidatus Pacebacteria bacterium CG_4_10_14_3_um_filter_34_15]|nr:hypothetical protein [Candidatus Pacearchaeota archaeon]NCQ66058.1 hypothetical protein [Candidatus Paceibacterota bacterium]OIO43623.1 MAG: hypothetical protein AUJ41_04605 [Candidatus Pacebacteria bacterium CG1_02_43_31]PIQ81240.1 MAG: hypothetical protein COV78_01370 [Candidatus Pacebacteria bacterium CG11_big_fil_rev_8_21_14_0_20_34_55]PIX81472.1 MAG: hypothetical protein COZ34_03275 [Candidatus Pacebacteria bacterium CG_4_10_14_3_um_filter_34_15]PJC43657.1 MAG: hypothetical protein CO0